MSHTPCRIADTSSLADVVMSSITSWVLKCCVQVKHQVCWAYYPILMFRWIYLSMTMPDTSPVVDLLKSIKCSSTMRVKFYYAMRIK